MPPDHRADKGSRKPYLVIEHVEKDFGKFRALNDVSLTIDEGEFVCFLGPSGCGKTTLLRAIAGLDIQTRGRIVQAGRDVSSLPPSERDFGIVFQSYALFPNLTVERNVGYGLQSTGRRPAEIGARVGELLALVGLEDQGKKYPSQLSGGQQQRVALARALAMSPGLLLLDEPLSALDARVRMNLRHEIKSLQRRLGVTTVMVTHDQEEALTMADRIVVMNHGVIEQVGTPAEIYRQPANAYVAGFIGTMNFLPVTVMAASRVRLDGGLEMSCSRERIKPGTDGPATLCIRPEDVQVRGIKARVPNTFKARIGEMEFLGSYFRTRLTPTGTALEVIADFSINAVADLKLEPNSEITAAFPPDRIQVFPGRM